MKKLRSFWTDESGSFVSMFIILICLFLVVIVSQELARLSDHREEVENILQRGVNTALEDMLRDTKRWDYENVLSGNTLAVRQRLDRYLRGEMNLQGGWPSYRKVSARGDIVWRLVFSDFIPGTATGSPFIQVKGSMFVGTVLTMIDTEYEFPFSVRSRNFRLD